jgi:hypothetical protein
MKNQATKSNNWVEFDHAKRLDRVAGLAWVVRRVKEMNASQAAAVHASFDALSA